MFDASGLILLVSMIGLITKRISPMVAISVAVGVVIIELLKWLTPHTRKK